MSTDRRDIYVVLDLESDLPKRAFFTREAAERFRGKHEFPGNLEVLPVTLEPEEARDGHFGPRYQVDVTSGLFLPLVRLSATPRSLHFQDYLTPAEARRLALDLLAAALAAEEGQDGS